MFLEARTVCIKWPIWLKNGTSFYHYNNLSLYQNKRFTLEFSDGDQLKGAIFKIADAFIDNIVKILDRKRFMQYGTKWFVYKFNITKAYFEKCIKNGSIQKFS